MTTEGWDIVRAHIERPMPPWRKGRMTECGRQADEFRVVLTRDQAAAKIKAEGQARAAFGLCMTCWQTATRHQDWAHSPSSVIARDVGGWGTKRAGVLDEELRALEGLWALHREDYDAELAAIRGATSLDDVRRERNRRRGSGAPG